MGARRIVLVATRSGKINRLYFTKDPEAERRRLEQQAINNPIAYRYLKQMYEDDRRIVYPWDYYTPLQSFIVSQCVKFASAMHSHIFGDRQPVALRDAWEVVPQGAPWPLQDDDDDDDGETYDEYDWEWAQQSVAPAMYL